jgi:hypothetical protein
MRLILLVVSLALGQVKLQAQTVPGLKTYSQSDTVRAIEHLFAAKRTGSKIYLGVGLPLTLIGAGTAFLVTTLATTIKAGEGKEKAVPIIVASGGIGLVPSSIGFARFIRFSRSRERAIIAAYQNHTSLPKWVQRRLKPKFFW